MTKKIVAIGGGTGLSTLLRGLKKFPVKLTAVVAVTDEGGSSGLLRKELNIIPPGDIRNCLVALSSEESLMSCLFQYRFKQKGSLHNHSFGNLFLAAISGLCGSFEKGIMEASKVLAIKGDVLPVTLSSIRLKALLSNGKMVFGERNISSLPPSVFIKELFLVGKNIKPNPKVISALSSADFIILGPGSLYTSIISNLLVPDVVSTIKSSSAKKIYISNLMTQPGETNGYTLKKHLDALRKYLDIEFDYILVNRGKIPSNLLKKYLSKNATPVVADIPDGFTRAKIKYGNFISQANYARHCPVKLASAIMNIINKGDGNNKVLI